MLKKEFTYTDPEDESEKSETVYFHLYEADLVKLQMSVSGGMEDLLKRLVQTDNAKGIIDIFDDLISKSVGYRNERGKFVKTKQYTEEFMSSEQYSELFLELVGTTEKALEFIKAILPAKLSQEIDEKALEELTLPKSDVEISPGKKLEEYTRDELLKMPQDQFDGLVSGLDPYSLPKEVLVIKMQRDLAAKASTN